MYSILSRSHIEYLNCKLKLVHSVANWLGEVRNI
jgi:hypothetical protein